MKTPPLALYAHFPWCVQKCPYCDFNSHTLQRRAAGAALHRGVDARSRCAGGRGGRSRRWSAFFSVAARRACFRRLPSLACSSTHGRGSDSSTDMEITLEANPGTIERGRFAEYRAAGITRVSLGAQSFDARQLKLLGPHSFGRRNPACRRGAARCGPRQLQSRPHVRAAGTNAPPTPKPICARPRAGARASVAIPPDDRARHGVRRCAAGAAGGRSRRGDAGTFAARAARCGFRAVRSFRLCAAGRALRPQPQLLELRRLPRHRRRRARQDFGLGARTQRAHPADARASPLSRRRPGRVGAQAHRRRAICPSNSR